MGRLVSRLFREDEGQDIVEYALLIAFVGLAGMAAWVAIRDAISDTYAAWDAAEQDSWESPDPQ